MRTDELEMFGLLKQYEFEMDNRIASKKKYYEKIFNDRVGKIKESIDRKVQSKINKQIRLIDRKYTKLLQKKKQGLLKKEVKIKTKSGKKIGKGIIQKITSLDGQINKEMKRKYNKTEVLTLIQKFVRLSESDMYGMGECISCGRILHYKKANGGHFISRICNAFAFCLDNIHFQCRICNKLMSMNIPESQKIKDKYARNLICKIGLARYSEMMDIGNQSQIIAVSQNFLRDLYDRYLHSCEELEKTKIVSK